MSYQPSVAEVADFIRAQVAAGFDSVEEIADDAVAIYQADPDTVDRLVAAAVGARAEAQRAWPAETDCDRLDRAFAALDRAGVVARQHFACCGGCGDRQLTDLVHQLRAGGRRVDGYVFYHRQDTDGAVGGEALHLRYTAMPRSLAATVDIGRRVVAVLRTHGLSVVWDEDVTRTIQLAPFDWKRRGAPVSSLAWTAAELADRWCRELPGAMAADLATRLGELYGEAALAAGRADVALAWARAPLANVHAELTRSRSLMRVALAAPGGEVAGATVASLWTEAYATAPYGRDGTIVDLLAADQLTGEAVRAAAGDRVSDTADDLFGAAAIAWHLARDPEPVDDPGYRAARLARVQRWFDSASDRSGDASARLAIAAALWLLHTRAGDRDGAEAAGQFVIDNVTSSALYGVPPFAQRAAVAAAAELGRLGELPVDDIAHDLSIGRALVDVCARSGQVDPIAGTSRGDLAARLARTLPDDPRAPAWLERANIEGELEELYTEGLLSLQEVHDTRLELAALRGHRGDPVGAWQTISEIAAECRDETESAGAWWRDQLAKVSRGEGRPSAAYDPRWSDAADRRALDKLIATWTGATTARERLRHWRSASRLLDAAAALAATGDVAGGGELIATVLGDDDDAVPAAAEGSLIRAWVATGDLDRALARAREMGYRVPADGVAALAVSLAELGRVDEALALLGPAFDRFPHRADRVALAPAVVAVAGDPAACAAAMIDAWRAGVAALDAITPAAATSR